MCVRDVVRHMTKTSVPRMSSTIRTLNRARLNDKSVTTYRAGDPVKPKIVEIFEYRGMKCVIAKFVFRGFARKRDPHIKHSFSYSDVAYHNGYVKTSIKIDYDVMNELIKSVELTYSGSLKHLGRYDELARIKKLKGWFIGFDTIHHHNIHNIMNQETMTKKAVKIKLRELCDELLSDRNVFQRYLAMKL